MCFNLSFIWFVKGCHVETNYTFDMGSPAVLCAGDTSKFTLHRNAYPIKRLFPFIISLILVSLFLPAVTHTQRHRTETGSVPSCFLEVFSVNNLSAVCSFLVGPGWCELTSVWTQTAFSASFSSAFVSTYTLLFSHWKKKAMMLVFWVFL